MKNFLLSLFVCLPALALAQNPTECGASSGNPSNGGCCYDCTCYTCAEVDICANRPGPLGDPSGCVSGGCANCDTADPEQCASWTENYYGPEGVGVDQGCVPIDGGLGFLIAGGLGMGVLGVRRRKELELEA